MTDMIEAALVDRFMSFVHPEPNSGCWLWTGHWTYNGYGTIGVKGKSVRAHRLSVQLFKGGMPADMFACHKCDTPACVNPDHLFIGTREDNTADQMRKDRRTRNKGTKNPISKLTEADIPVIHRLFKAGHTYAALGRKFGVDEARIRGIVAGKEWRHVPVEIEND
jgi:hypothetical protein